MRTIAAPLNLPVVIEFCRSVCAEAQPVMVSHQPLAGEPFMECFRIVPEHISAHGGKQLTGWAIWYAEPLHIEAEFHSVWESPTGEVVDLTPRPFALNEITFLADPSREYRGRQIDNIRQALTDDRDVVRMLYLQRRRFQILNKGDLADQHGAIELPTRVRKEVWKLDKEMLQIQSRLARRYR